MTPDAWTPEKEQDLRLKRALAKVTPQNPADVAAYMVDLAAADPLAEIERLRALIDDARLYCKRWATEVPPPPYGPEWIAHADCQYGEHVRIVP